MQQGPVIGEPFELINIKNYLHIDSLTAAKSYIKTTQYYSTAAYKACVCTTTAHRHTSLFNKTFLTNRNKTPEQTRRTRLQTVIIYSNRKCTITLITLPAFYLMWALPHNSLHSYAVVPPALSSSLPLSHLPSLHLLHTVVVPRALLLQPGFPPPSNKFQLPPSKSFLQTLDAKESSELQWDGLRKTLNNTLKMFLGLKYISWRLTILTTQSHSQVKM